MQIATVVLSFQAIGNNGYLLLSCMKSRTYKPLTTTCMLSEELSSFCLVEEVR